MITAINLSYRKAVRILTGACGLLFSVFSFVYLFVFQKETIDALHYALSQGKTHYSPLAGALILTAVLLILRWGINKLLKLKGLAHAFSYFPPCLLLGVLTDLDESVFHGGGIADKWMWLLPLLLLIYGAIAYGWQRVSSIFMQQGGSVSELMITNFATLLLLFLMTVGQGNTNIHFHHELAVEHAIRQQDYAAARRVGQKSLETTHTLTALRAYAMSREGTLGDCLFAYPQPYGADGLLFAPHAQDVLRTNADTLYAYLGARPHATERTLDYLSRICQDEVGRHTALDYYLNALLLDKQIDRFAAAIDTFYFAQDTLPRYYREAITLYHHLHPASGREPNDSLMVQQLNDYLSLQQTFTTPTEEKNQMRRAYGDTYWWYYQYQ